MKIVDRIVTALLAFAVIPVAIFTPLLHWIYRITAWSLVNGITSLFGDNTISSANDTGLTQDDMSLYSLYDLIKGFGVDMKELFQNAGEPHITVEPYLVYVKVAVAFFVLALVIALAIGIVSIFSNAKKTQMGMSLAGIASLIGMNVSFSKFAEALVEGKFTVGALLDIDFLSYITKVEVLNFSSAWVFMIMLFVAIILWNLSVILTTDKTEQAQKQIKKSSKKRKKS